MREPPQTGVKETSVPKNSLNILNAEVEELLRKDAIETVPTNQIQAGFYSTFFLVPKKNVKMRPVLNLRPLNKYQQKNHFKIDTMSKVLNLVKPKDWAISLDLTEAYLHIPLFPKHRKYLRFCIAGQCFQWRCLCFGPTSAPRVFTKIVSEIAAHLRAQNIRLASHLDNWLAVNQIRRQLLQDREKMSKSFDITRLYNQQRKVRANSKTTNHIHRGVISFRPRNSHSNSRQNKEDRISSEEYLSRSQSSKRFSSPSGYNSIMFGIDSKCSPLYEAHPTTSLFLETIITRSRNTHSSYSTSKITSSVVVKFSKHHEGQIFTSAANKYNHNDRCFKNRLWGSCRQAFHSGHMVRIPTETTYKLPGVGGSVPYSKTLSSGIEKPQCLSQMRQYNSGSVYKQTRGNKITTSVFQNMGSMGFCHRKQHSDQSSIYFRHKKRVSGSVVEKQNSCHRMDITQTNSGSDFSSVGSSSHRPLCIHSESPGTDFLFLDSTSSSLSIRCTDNFLGGNVCVCISSHLLDPKSSATYVTVSLSDNINCTQMATQTLVYRSATTSDGLSEEVTSLAKPTSLAQHSDKSSKSRSFQSACLASIDNSFQEKGFSSKSRKLLSASWRSGTQKKYSSKFNRFCSWSSAGKIDPYSASLVQVADFLTDLFHAGLQYR